MDPLKQHPDELLPWYANGTLTGGEHRAVESHLATCERCRQELALLTQLRRRVKQLDAGDMPGELARERLLREIRRERPRRFAWWQPALAAAIAVIVLQSALLVNLRPRAPQAITPLGSPPAAEAVLQVRFVPDATEAQIRAALREVDGVLIDGPGALGVYRVRLEGLDATQTAQIERAVERMRKRPRVIAHVAAE
jgi:anti-sigma factor RsiW